MPKQANLTWVALVHKEGGNNDLKHYRPISMVGCVYKVISELLANKMRPFMPRLVGEVQSAFVGGRKILDRTLIACEVVNWVRKKRVPAWIVKLDFQKAYDRVRWSFVEKVLLNMGFGVKWRGWVQACLKASMSILVNGCPTKLFISERGLRQGDPISPFLFVLIGEILNSTMCRLREKGLLKPLEVGRNRVKLSHLQFADDTILFCPCELETIRGYRRLLKGFEMMTGMKINFRKSAIIGLNCDEEVVDMACDVLGCSKANLPIKYLGIPLGANPKRTKTWRPVINKIEERLSGWKGKLLSKAGKLVLIKAVINNLPMYYLSIFRMSVTVAKKLCLCNVVSFGESLNLIGLEGCGSGGVWTNVMQIGGKNKELLGVFREGLQLIIGNGNRTSFWHSGWINGGALKDRFPKLFSVALDKDCHISDCGIWDGLSWVWQFQWRCQLWQWEQEEVQELLNFLPKLGTFRGGEDSVAWQFESSGSFSMNSFLQTYLNQQGQSVGVVGSSGFSKLWKGPTLPRVKLLCWFVMHEKLNTRERLFSCGVVPQPERVLCGKLPESVHHLFFGCEQAWKVWSFVLKEFNVMWGWPGESLKCFESCFGRNVPNNYKERWVLCFFAVIWSLWKGRNKMIFNEELFSVESAINEVVVCVNYWSRPLAPLG
ncbi:uncharacterized protein LOC107475226 [Arachis duranensis]|uniref:Uncharacterized protein LOC107475226 n=1 Tax=Arachis duranensis TaxID=130453 RepID=A0A6P4CG65_ARADU|nr:uncharacterized protein LOC107475226 [Arachis duranensis]